jgi:phthalate 4,5-dioxygenase oxygenase subunit
MMVAAAKAFQQGAPAIGTAQPVRYASLASFEGVVPNSTDWRTLGAPADTPVTAK